MCRSLCPLGLYGWFICISSYSKFKIVYTDPQMTIRAVSENLESDSIRVALEWTQENKSLYLYNVSVTPQVASILTERTGLQLNVSYNTLYNVRILVTSYCGQPAVRGTNVTLTCTSGLMLSGPNTSTCMGMENGNQTSERWCVQVRACKRQQGIHLKP